MNNSLWGERNVMVFFVQFAGNGNQTVYDTTNEEQNDHNLKQQ
ncbi:hypothetical protein ACT3CD_05900 [Geofilum sp. OHC36d9]